MTNAEKAEFQKALGSHLRKVRTEKGISAAELARLTFIEKPHITRLETGGSNPTSYTLKVIAEALGMSFEELFKGFDWTNTGR